MLTTFRARKAQLGLSNSELEQLADLGEGNASKILSGDREPRATTVERICRALRLEQKFVPTTPENVGCDFAENSQLSESPDHQRRFSHVEQT